MSKVQKKVLWIILPLCLLGAVLLWRGEIGNYWHSLFPSTTPPPQEQVPPMVQEEELPPPYASPALMERYALQEQPPEDAPPDLAQEVPESPPLPRIDPAATQEERFQAFHMKDSIDHIVRREETFQVDGKMLSLESILGKLSNGVRMERVVPFIRESSIGPSIRRPIQEPLAPHLQAERYYGVRVVRPSENIWTIHYGIFQEYMARRGIEIAPAADRPLADGRSSGVGRLLKFMEGMVLVYDTKGEGVVKNIHVIQPHTVLAFFNISDLFAAFDQLSPNTLLSLRYVDRGIYIEKPGERVPVIGRTTFQQ